MPWDVALIIRYEPVLKDPILRSARIFAALPRRVTHLSLAKPTTIQVRFNEPFSLPRTKSARTNPPGLYFTVLIRILFNSTFIAVSAKEAYDPPPAYMRLGICSELRVSIQSTFVPTMNISVLIYPIISITRNS